MTNSPNIRIATIEDAPRILEIYAPYVETTSVTFELSVPDQETFANRVRTTLQRYPYLVAEDESGIVGFTYASPYRPREAYSRAIETSIYVKQGYKGRGLGRRLYTALATVLHMQNVYNMNACIAYIDPEDEYVSRDSLLFHERVGFKVVGHFTRCGRKFDRWYDVVWMEKLIADHDDNPGDFIPFPELDRAEVDAALSTC